MKEYLPKDMQAGLSSRATTASLRRINRAKRIELELRPNHYIDYGKRVKKIILKMKVRGVKEINYAKVAKAFQEKFDERK